MDFKKQAYILTTIQSLHANQSGTGKTHVQKALSLLADSGKVEVPFNFLLYKHGPYSFDIESELEQMKSYDAVEVSPNANGYGVVLKAGQMSKYALDKAPISSQVKEAINKVCKFIGSNPVKILERLATASWIYHQEKIADPIMMAERLHELKPHIKIEDAKSASDTILAWNRE